MGFYETAFPGCITYFQLDFDEISLHDHLDYLTVLYLHLFSVSRGHQHRPGPPALRPRRITHHGVGIPDEMPATTFPDFIFP